MSELVYEIMDSFFLGDDEISVTEAWNILTKHSVVPGDEDMKELVSDILHWYDFCNEDCQEERTLKNQINFAINYIEELY